MLGNFACLRRVQQCESLWALIVVKPVLSGHLKIDKTKVLMTNGSLMQVKGIAFCRIQYF